MVSTISTKRLNELGCVLGLDCSKYQKNITWNKVYAAGIRFAFIKITEGTNYSEDDVYNLKARILEAQKQGVKTGYYHFAQPGNVNIPEDDAKQEITNVLNHLKILPKCDFPIVLDVEAYSNNNIWDNKMDHMDRFINTFITEMKKNGHDIIIYSYRSFIDDNTDHIFGDYPLWLASYLNDPEHYTPTLPSGWSEWKIWQFTEKGRIDGYDGDIDLDVMKNEYFNQF